MTIAERCLAQVVFDKLLIPQEAVFFHEDTEKCGIVALARRRPTPDPRHTVRGSGLTLPLGRSHHDDRNIVRLRGESGEAPHVPEDLSGELLRIQAPVTPDG